MLDLKKMTEDFDKFVNSEEGQKSLEELAEKWAKEDEFAKRWKNRIKNFLKQQTEENLEELFEKFHKHAEKRRDILWKQHYDGETSLYNPLFGAIKKLGKKSKRKRYNVFTTAMYDWKGYQIESYCGQGCFHSLSKI